jgi:hypothetical protein
MGQFLIVQEHCVYLSEIEAMQVVDNEFKI